MIINKSMHKIGKFSLNILKHISMKTNLRNIAISNGSRNKTLNSVMQKSEMVLFSFHKSLCWLYEGQIRGAYNETFQDQLEVQTSGDERNEPSSCSRGKGMDWPGK